MTKTTAHKAPRLTKAQKLTVIELETQATEAQQAQERGEEYIPPVESEVNDPHAPAKKPMKVVKTVKTGVGAQILQHIADGVLSNKEIVAKVLEDNPLRKTTYACVAWYQSQVKAGKIDLPEAQEEVMMTEEELEQEGSEE
jgi:hypothetical protein